MSSALALMLSAGFAGLTAEQFQELMQELRQELAPSGPLEKVLVAQVLSYLVRLRKAAVAEPEGTIKDAAWLRYHSMAERGFWKYYNELMKGRRARARAAAKPAAPACVSDPAVAPAPAAVAPPARVTMPAAVAARAAAPAPAASRPAPGAEPHRRADRSPLSEANRRRIQAECLALMAAQEPAGTSTFLPISVAPAASAAPKAEPVAAGS